jgi:hypothetical protein
MRSCWPWTEPASRRSTTRTATLPGTRCKISFVPPMRLEVGGGVIGDVPSWRVENMPYGWQGKGPLRDGRHDRDPTDGVRFI